MLSDATLSDAILDRTALGRTPSARRVLGRTRAPPWAAAFGSGAKDGAREMVVEAGDDLGPVTCWKFGDDTIDCSDALADALPAGGASTTVPLAGTHLTPVFFKLSATDVDPRLGAPGPG